MYIIYHACICRPLNNSTELKKSLMLTYAAAAQYSQPPNYYPVNMVCQGIDNASNNSSDILEKILSGLVSFTSRQPCYINQPRILSETETETETGWSWQVIIHSSLYSSIILRLIFPYVTPNFF